jgi:hypothetical protein
MAKRITAVNDFGGAEILGELLPLLVLMAVCRVRDGVAVDVEDWFASHQRG